MNIIWPIAGTTVLAVCAYLDVREEFDLVRKHPIGTAFSLAVNPGLAVAALWILYFTL